jgi:hypothetical protein
VGGGERNRRAFFFLHHSLSALRLCQCKHTDNDPSKTEGRPTYSMFYTLAGTGRLRVWLPESDEKVEITYEPLDLLIIDANKLVHAGWGGGAVGSLGPGDWDSRFLAARHRIQRRHRLPRLHPLCHGRAGCASECRVH